MNQAKSPHTSSLGLTLGLLTALATYAIVFLELRRSNVVVKVKWIDYL